MYSVQRGQLEITDATAVINLPTPVPVGESFPLVTSAWDSSIVQRAAVSARLQGESGGNYTQLLLERGEAGNNPLVSWEVVTGSVFSVQEHVFTLAPTESTDDASITVVDPGKTFLVGSAHVTVNDFSSLAPRWRLPSTTSLEVRRQGTDGTLTVPVYVVEMDGASVEHVLFTLAGSTDEETISTVDLSQAVVFASGDSTSSDVREGPFIADLPNATTVRARRARSNITADPNVFISAYVVSHPGFSVQRVSDDGSAVVEEVAVSPVDSGAAFLATNMSNAIGNHSNASRTQSRVFLSDPDEVTVERQTNTNTFTYAFELVEAAASGLTPAVISEVSATSEEITISIDSYDATASRHDMYHRVGQSMEGDPETNGTLIAEDIDPEEDLRVFQLQNNEDHFFQLVSEEDGTDPDSALSNEISATMSFATLSDIRNRVHNLFHRPDMEVPAPDNLHIALLTENTGGVLVEKAAEDNYARVAYAQGAPTAGEGSNAAAYEFPDPSAPYEIIGIAVVEGNTIGQGRVWGVILYDTPRTVTSSDRTIAIDGLVSKGVTEGIVTELT